MAANDTRMPDDQRGLSDKFLLIVRGRLLIECIVVLQYRVR